MIAMIGLQSGGCVTINEWGHPDLSEFTLVDYWRALGNIKRFSGHTDFSVLDHIVFWMDQLQDPAERRHWFIHEIGETLGIGDINFRLKREWASSLCTVEERMFQFAASKFFPGRLVVPYSDPVMKEFDLRAGNAEAKAFFSPEVFSRMMAFYGMDESRRHKEVPHGSHVRYPPFEELYESLKA